MNTEEWIGVGVGLATLGLVVVAVAHSQPVPTGLPPCGGEEGCPDGQTCINDICTAPSAPDQCLRCPAGTTCVGHFGPTAPVCHRGCSTDGDCVHPQTCIGQVINDGPTVPVLSIGLCQGASDPAPPIIGSDPPPRDPDYCSSCPPNSTCVAVNGQQAVCTTGCTDNSQCPNNVCVKRIFPSAAPFPMIVNGTCSGDARLAIQ